MAQNQRSHRIELNRLRSFMVGQGRTVDEIAMEIQRRYRYSWRAAYRHAVGLTLVEAAESYNLAADDADAHLTAPRLSVWENWPRTTNRRPTAFNLLTLSKIYGTHPARLITSDEQQHLDHRDRELLRHLNQPKPAPSTTPALPRTQKPSSEPDTLPADSGLRTPWTTSECLRILRLVTDTGTMEPIERRMFVSLTGAAAMTPAHEWLIARAHTDIARPGSNVLPVGVVDHLDLITAELRQKDDTMGGADLLKVIRAVGRHVVDLIENTSYPETLGQRLHSTAAELLRLAGWSCFEANDHALAQRYWIAALRTAHTAGDRAVGANILGFMSNQAVELGQIRASVTLAETARTGYRSNSPSVTAMLDLRAAEAYAIENAATACQRALDAAFDRLTDTPGSMGEPSWSYWVDEAAVHHGAGDCYLFLQDWERARGHYRDAMRLHGDSFAREGTLRHIFLAQTYLRQDQPDLDQALAHGEKAIDALSGTVNSPRCAKYLAPLIKGLAPFQQNREVTEFTDRATTLLTPTA